ncbi:MAG: hypothetical protein IJX47_08590 [Clostridia bacterium]|nr:hypothetical protein [Clostridia bacterium]
MKEKLKNFGCLMIGLLLLPYFLLFILLASLFLLATSPFRRAKYKKSHFHRDFGDKYTFDLYQSEAYAIYNAIRDADLPIVPTPYRSDKGTIVDVLFTYRDILLYVPDTMPYYDKEKDKWECEIAIEVHKDDEEYETVDFNEYISKQIEERTLSLPDLPETSHTVILLRNGQISEESLPYAEASELFLIYDRNNIPEALQKLIAEQ